MIIEDILAGCEAAFQQRQHTLIKNGEPHNENIRNNLLGAYATQSGVGIGDGGSDRGDRNAFDDSD